ncbi:hypothetical protein EVS84_04610 [Pseudomonas koreensis]|uniref:Uncharacterized protein n=1 Tax=Pseudomonas koreensis TaxID=198620 RepID=A0A4Q4LAD0_9PSED|nr:hypothetical protein EVS84_04610 [Pseudomonas koreensis]
MPYKDGAFGQTQRQGASCKRQEQAKAFVANRYAQDAGLKAHPLWERACSRMRWVIQLIRRLVQRFREQAAPTVLTAVIFRGVCAPSHISPARPAR